MEMIWTNSALMSSFSLPECVKKIPRLCFLFFPKRSLNLPFSSQTLWTFKRQIIFRGLFFLLFFCSIHSYHITMPLKISTPLLYLYRLWRMLSSARCSVYGNNTYWRQNLTACRRQRSSTTENSGCHGFRRGNFFFCVCNHLRKTRLIRTSGIFAWPRCLIT